MSGIVFFGVALAGGVGACARFGLDRFVQRAVSSWGEPAAAKLGILVVNVVGCFLAGVATQLVPDRVHRLFGWFHNVFDGGPGRGDAVG